MVQASTYDAVGVRVGKREGASTTLYLAPDFEVRDGLATTYVKAGHTSLARVEEPAFATTFFPDLAPLASAGSIKPRPACCSSGTRRAACVQETSTWSPGGQSTRKEGRNARGVVPTCAEIRTTA